MDASATSDDLLLRFNSSDGKKALILEDDGRVAYAYLLEEERIVSDVWLYNVEPAPEVVNWSDTTLMPFLNPAPYCKSGVVSRLGHQSVIQCNWLFNGVELFVNDILWARLDSGARPGRSLFASSNGPLAQPLENIPGGVETER